jgi:hypothetical protein
MEPSRSPTTSPQTITGRFPGNNARRCIIAGLAGSPAQLQLHRLLPVLVHGALFRAAKAFLPFASRPLDLKRRVAQGHSDDRSTVPAGYYELATGRRTNRRDASKRRN